MINQPVSEGGFTLVEMALVLLIMGLLAKSAVGPLQALQEHGKRQQAEQQIQQVRQVILAHLVAYGALPCPLPVSANVQSPISVHRTPASLVNAGNRCVNGSGFIDAYGLSIDGMTDERGALLDPWGRALRYVVSMSNAQAVGNTDLPDWTTPGEASAVGISHLASDIVLCNALANTNCSGRSVRSDQIAFVIFSTASDSSSAGLQAENLDDDNYFIAAEESIVMGAEFDDIMVWASTAEVSYWLLRMGWLP